MGFFKSKEEKAKEEEKLALTYAAFELIGRHLEEALVVLPAEELEIMSAFFEQLDKAYLKGTIIGRCSNFLRLGVLKATITVLMKRVENNT